MQKNTQMTEQNDRAAHRRGGKAVVVHGAGTPEQDHASLAVRLRRGDRAAAEELVDAFYGRIYLFMRAVGHDRQMSEDLTQETFMRAWYHIGQLRDGKALTGWLFRIAGNVSRLYWRRHRDVDAVHSGAGDVEQVGGSDALKRASGQEELSCLRRAVTRLPRKLQQAIVLHYMEQLTIAEAAEAAGVRQGTLKSRLNRALEALRKEMGRR
jgi:RNA polymerase sigma-70 factor (ECF subfamily)